MAKRQTFADKVAKVKAAGVPHCPVCSEIITVVKVCQSERSAATGRHRIVEKIVKVCKCNAGEVYG
jgi:hypothetical protein